MRKKVLFIVGTIYQLLNAITLRVTECSDLDCDLFLKSSTPWDKNVISHLVEMQLFGDIICPDITKNEALFFDMDDDYRVRVVQNPSLLFGGAPIEQLYDKLFIGAPNIVSKLIYRHHILNEKRPEVYVFEDGLLSYIDNIKDSEKLQYLQNEYAEEPLSEAVIALYLYQPELYSVNNNEYEVRKIISPSEREDVKKILLEVFEVENLPQESFIYFEDYYFANRFVSNDYSLFEQLASVVGREDIITKLHPRSYYNRFAFGNWKTMQGNRVPWEIQLLNNDVRSKTLVSISSTAILSPYTIFGMDIHVISLDKMYEGTAIVYTKEGMKNFVDKLMKKINANKVYFHTPRTSDEIEEVVRYLKLIKKCENKRRDS